MLEKDEVLDANKLKAYFIYLYRLETGTPGDALSDWLDAEAGAECSSS